MRSLGNRIFSHVSGYWVLLHAFSWSFWGQVAVARIRPWANCGIAEWCRKFCLERVIPRSEVLVHQVNVKTNVYFIYICRNQKAECSVQGFDQTVIGLTWKVKFDVCVTVHHWYSNINSQLDVTVIILLIISISSTCSPAGSIVGALCHKL